MEFDNVCGAGGRGGGLGSAPFPRAGGRAGAVRPDSGGGGRAGAREVSRTGGGGRDGFAWSAASGGGGREGLNLEVSGKEVSFFACRL